MASIPTQEEVLAATRKSQEAMIAAIKNWLETVRTATPKVAAAYAPLTDRLGKLSPVSLPFADKLPTPQDAVARAYNMAEELLAGQRTFAEELLKAMTPLMPGRGQAAAKRNGSSEPKVPAQRVWQEAVAVSEPQPATVTEPKTIPVSEPKTVATAGTEPKAPVRPAAKSTTARPAPRTTATKATTARTTAAKSTAAKGGAGTSTPKRTNASRAPKGTDAG
jgi:hypothetical protein